MRTLGRRFGALLGTILLLGAIALLWELRPSLPDLPRSLSDPLTVSQLKSLGHVLAWLALHGIALRLLLGLLRAGAHEHAQPLPLAARQERFRATSHRRRASSRAPSQIGRFREEPYVLTLAQRPETSSSAGEPSAPATETATAPVAAGERLQRDRDTTEMPAIRVSVLGPLSIDGVRRRRRGLRSSTQELIAYLALRPNGAGRDQLLELLWPGEDPARSRQRLWQSIADARSHLGEAINRKGDNYRLDRAHVEVDAEELDRLLAQADRAESAAAERELLDRALALFRGEPLAGSDYPWADGETRRLRAAFVALNARAAHARLESGDARGALDACERGLQLETLDEGLWRLAMEAEATLGLRSALDERYEKLRALLDERLGLEPQRETRALYLSLLGQD